MTTNVRTKKIPTFLRKLEFSFTPIEKRYRFSCFIAPPFYKKKKLTGNSPKFEIMTPNKNLKNRLKKKQTHKKTVSGIFGPNQTVIFVGVANCVKPIANSLLKILFFYRHLMMNCFFVFPKQRRDAVKQR